MHAGVDGCSAGWIVVHAGGAAVFPTFGAVLSSLPPDTVVGVDIPIGLLDATVAGGRRCDRMARRALGPGRMSSVFSAPPRPTLGLRSLREVQDAGFRMTLQTLNIVAKVADVDAVVDPELQQRVHEVHPELAFVAMAGDEPLAHSKRRAAGRDERRALLERHGVVVPALPRGAAVDDLLDACAAGWSAHRISTAAAERAPAEPDLDARGLRMEISW